MNFAEGKGPKQVKTPYTLGQFVTIYGNGSQSNVNPAPVPYPVSGVVSGNVPGSAVPGLNISVNGNGRTDVGFVCSPGSNSSLQDLESTYITVTAETGWTGSAVVYFQGTMLRYIDNDDYSSSNWITIASGTVISGNVPVQISAQNTAYNAYRIIASGTTTSASGIIDWVIPEMFTDYSAMFIGANAADVNGNLGQMSIQYPRNYTISGGQYVESEGALGTEYVPGNSPLENTKANHTWIG